MKTVGLVLGSGGARGWAHIGVIRALQAANIPINCIAGASIGALVGAVHAAGELDDLEEFIRALDWRAVVSFFDVVFPTSGLLDGNRVYELLSDHLHELKIEEAGIHFCCVATDLLTGKEVRLRTGPMVDAVRASISIPGVFTPFQKEGRFLGDGGIINPMPVDVMREMGADVVIAVNLNRNSDTESLTVSVRESLSTKEDDNPSSEIDRSQRPDQGARESALTTAEISPDTESFDGTPREQGEGSATETDGSNTANRITLLLERLQQRYELIHEQLQVKMENWMPEQKEGMNIFDVIGSSLNVMEQQVTQGKLSSCPPDILIEPALGNFGIFDFHRADAIIEEGYRCMEQRLPELQQKLTHG